MPKCDLLSSHQSGFPPGWFFMRISDDVEKRIKEKLDKLKTKAGYKMFQSDLLFPSRQKAKDRKIAEEYSERMETKLKELNPLIRSMRSHIDYIGDPDKYVAAYLLIGKSYSSLNAIIHLLKLGYSFQIVELVRSSMESLYLASLFFEEGQEDKLERWFKGDIIRNRDARKALSKAVNDMDIVTDGTTIPMESMLADIYSIYSSYTHSGYAALFDFIDIFTEDFDFQQYAQFHYCIEHLHLIDNLYTNILLGLKHYYIRARDEENLTQVEKLLSNEKNSFANPEEISEELKRYRN